jgi:hypothetical protein
MLTGLTLALSGCARRAATIDAGGQPPITESTLTKSPGESAEEGAFAFPTDRGGELLASLLPPSEKDRRRIEVARQPRPSAPSRALDAPELPLSPSDTVPPRVKLEKPLPRLRPGDVPEAIPFVDQLAPPQLPNKQVLAAGGRVRLSSPDVNQPPPLPMLAQQVVERASLDDPTLEASVLLALAVAPPLRMTPAPFIRLNLPNPFEHRDAVRLLKEPEELPLPVAVSLRTPNKP